MVFSRFFLFFSTQPLVALLLTSDSFFWNQDSEGCEGYAAKLVSWLHCWLWDIFGSLAVGDSKDPETSRPEEELCFGYVAISDFRHCGRRFDFACHVPVSRTQTRWDCCGAFALGNLQECLFFFVFWWMIGIQKKLSSSFIIHLHN